MMKSQGAVRRKPPEKSRPGMRRASVAVLVLWAIALMSILAMYIGAGVRQRLDVLGRMETRHNLRWIARGGIEQALAELAASSDQDDFLSGVMAGHLWQGTEFAVGGGFAALTVAYQSTDFMANVPSDASPQERFGIEDEQGKLNVNIADDRMLARLFVALDIADDVSADELAAEIVGWRTHDNRSSDPSSAEPFARPTGNSGGGGKGAFFESPEELLALRGLTPERWLQLRPYVTVHGIGAVNINTASRPVLAALGFSVPVLHKILTFRCGPDESPGTADDRFFNDTSDIIALLSQEDALTSEEAGELGAILGSGMVTTTSQTFSLRSTGRLPDQDSRCEIRCVAVRDGVHVTVREWRLRYHVPEIK